MIPTYREKVLISFHFLENFFQKKRFLPTRPVFLLFTYTQRNVVLNIKWRVLVGLVGLMGLLDLIGLIGLIGLVGVIGMEKPQPKLPTQPLHPVP